MEARFLYVGWTLAMLMIGTGMLVYAYKADGGSFQTVRGKFMDQCAKDRKEYECVAMWRAGSR